MSNTLPQASRGPGTVPASHPAPPIRRAAGRTLLRRRAKYWRPEWEPWVQKVSERLSALGLEL